MATIILTGGGTAGHCIPHLAVLPYLKNDFDKIYYIGSENGIEKEIIQKNGIPYYSVPCAKFNRKLTAKNIKIPFTLVSGIHYAGKILDELKPDVIFSKGGYVSVPTVLAAKKRKIPVVAHESDYTIGLANKITSKYCKKILTSFSDTAKTVKNGEYIGAPIRSNLTSVKKIAPSVFGFKNDKPVIAITGGSQGAVAINKTVRDCLNDLLPKFNVIHICGKGNVDKNINKTGYYQTEYVDNIETVFSISSVCVTRAGSNALFELLSIKKPCVVIPLPKGISRGDQVLNAEYFQKLGLISVLQQNVLTKESLYLAITSCYANRYNIEKNLTNHPVNDKSRQISRILADYARR